MPVYCSWWWRVQASLLSPMFRPGRISSARFGEQQGTSLGFPGGSAGQESACNAEDLGCMATHSSILAWRIPTDRGAWQATVHGVTKSRTRLKQLSSTFINFCKVISTLLMRNDLLFLTSTDIKDCLKSTSFPKFK